MNLADEGHLIFKTIIFILAGNQAFFRESDPGLLVIKYFTFKYFPEGGLEPMQPISGIKR
jgi:hypothetical protein